MLDKIPNGILIYDLKKDGYTYLNKDMKGMIGLSSQAQNPSSLHSYNIIPTQLSQYHLFEKVSDAEEDDLQNDTHNISQHQIVENPNQNVERMVVSTRKFSVITCTQPKKSSLSVNEVLKLEQSTQRGIEAKEVHQNRRRMSLQEYIQSIASENSNEIHESEEIFKKKGEQRYLQIKTSKFQEGRQIFAICTDITRIMQMENQEQQMRATFFSSVAHELRTPLNSIIPILRLILESIQATNQGEFAKVAKYVKIILNSSLHLESIIEDALDISRIENKNFTLNMEMVDLREAIQEIREIMSFQIEQKRLSLTINISQSVPSRVWLDKKRFKQILFNLIGNAIKFTFEGGVKLQVNFDLENNILQTSVKDSGIGIQDDDLLKLFKFFGKLSKSKDINRGGMGLGLTISKMIILQLGGEIDVHSQPSQGSTFSFVLPISTIHIDPYKSGPEEKSAQEGNHLPIIEQLRQSSLPLEREEIAQNEGLNGMKLSTLQIQRRPPLRAHSSMNYFHNLDAVKKKGDTDQNLNSHFRLVTSGADLAGRHSQQNLSHRATSLNNNDDDSVHATELVLDSEDEVQCNVESFFAKERGQSPKLIAGERKPQTLSLMQMSAFPSRSTQQIHDMLNHSHLSGDRGRLLSIYIERTTKEPAPNIPIRVLSVDDSAYNLFVLKELLSVCEPGIEVTEALNGKIALEEYNKRRYDVIFMDLNMPVIDGFQVILILQLINKQAAWQIREQTSSYRPYIIALSAITRSQFEHLGDHLTKHFDEFRKFLTSYNILDEKPVCSEFLKASIKKAKERRQ
ncbi:hypothetical protein FGO68_gene2455 [Halteria grandinella]|uniref:histidine kinase n=1 Tax=Halteria grandinella TaxID=5974 RepID=A0A8J8P0V7_HALGN|nr:hypothetical protein FGO68_gene2455 [Halteria grandinella]